ncbi:MAG: GDP-mannose 4,6-dehydratase [Candidatus Diapherotrites archaeon]|nr:GDP-mannose 4,6-dehydratase [Candidatus Diapherotrites archaeon]
MAEQTKKFAGANVMITGGLGFIGSNLCHKLVALGAKVQVVDSLIPSYGGNPFNVQEIKGKIDINIADIRDENSMNCLVKDKDYIFNLAGQVSHLDSINDPYTDLEINCRSQMTLLEACRKNNDNVKVVFAGTRSEYGRTEYLPVDEKHPFNPTDVNGINKIAGEMYHLVYNRVHGIKASSLRLTNTFGPRQMMKNDRQTFLAWFMRLAIDNKTIKIFGDGKQLRDFNYVDDAVDAFLLAAASEKADGEAFNLGSGNGVSVLDITKKLIAVAGTGKLEMVPFPPEKKKIEIGDYYADYSKAKKILGWEPKVPLDAGLKKTIDYYRKFKAHYW